MKIIKWSIRILLVALLTLLSQVGGVVYMLSWLTHGYLNRIGNTVLQKRLLRIGSFWVLYSIVTFFIIPPLARMGGRVPMPLTETHYVRPVSFLTCFFNRHYVRPGLRDVAFRVGDKLHGQFPGAKVKYMDANFPFFNGYPLLPHISHKDGKKLDVAFCYTDKRSGQPTSDYPPHIAYGVSEGPNENEKDQIQYCESRGNWQYSYMSKMMPQGDRERYELDKKASRYMVEAFQNDSKIGKILIEPHLIPRLQLKNGKIRYHGCNSVRHDDHIHVQIR